MGINNWLNSPTYLQQKHNGNEDDNVHHDVAQYLGG